MTSVRRILVALPLALAIVCGLGMSVAFAQSTQVTLPGNNPPSGITNTPTTNPPTGNVTDTAVTNSPAGNITNTSVTNPPTNNITNTAATNPQNSTANTGAGNSGCAQTGTTGSALLNPLCASTLTQLLQEILAYVVILGGIFLTIMLVYVGFLFVRAQGKEEELRQARRALLWVVIGGILLLGAQALATVITSTVSSL